ncbi:hypothetical protein RhiirA5_357086 [Rhizophagus irregularis]|uniref:Uncharacterized protein n=3 Tax=Rhizophagus irregularis TaxID=588596 RepID=U9SUU3_RHIID|nr:hypothetical protein GLOIN_2v1496668 [Rhizophagus irregularis DAOM 181602=DAOM 197198]EXX67751.1 hypothetical protein RirG_111570 [Rhizophagus irregularis DAOM 197198w]PKC09157.1 hypothetical protein RhiirA5_357086 [Rhizophagus irregularis]PKC65129.1 hypothetical protein RhiirA1_420815 [Rhizophagus irregularis]PKY20129.1 hypothetical protein RhiirB3_407832 [Rhizophagus irregularis]POG82616.1 hypothetical protein GLOIN_2v1496668 [Rhizophagus irregularis DAOM 181602=DAOM 197198]|eukprot:XP_025189482.1 hypothetical protein GLOIN_2v1496668 [Rhizophagus irregularis DAOM 181602=DAOM 197198]
MSQNPNFSSNLRLTDLQADSRNNLDTFYNHTDSHSMTSNNISQVPFINSLNTVSSVPQCCPHVSQSNNYNSNGQPVSNHFVNLPNSTTFDSFQPQVNQCNIFKFEIPGFEIIVRPKSNQVMNLNNLNAQHQSSMNSYSPVAIMPSQLVNQNQNYINGNFVSNSHVNSVNNMNTDNLQYQNHQQFGYNNFQG